MRKNNKHSFPAATDLSLFPYKWDLHSHTSFTDGKHSVTEMINAACEQDFDLFAITEHVRSSSVKWWKQYVGEIEKFRRNKKTKILIGIEANAIGVAGNIDVPNEILTDTELVLGAVHGYYQDDTWEKIPVQTLSPEKALDYEIKKTVGLCHNSNVHVLAHCGWLFEKNFGPLPNDALATILREAQQTGTAVEINLRYTNDLHKMMKILFEINPLLSFGSNAHSIYEIACTKNIIEKYLPRTLHTSEGDDAHD